MRLEDDIAETAVRVCDQLASAVERYAAISGSGFGEIPESFLRDRVFDGLGDVLTRRITPNFGIGMPTLGEGGTDSP